MFKYTHLLYAVRDYQINSIFNIISSMVSKHDGSVWCLGPISYDLWPYKTMVTIEKDGLYSKTCMTILHMKVI